MKTLTIILLLAFTAVNAMAQKEQAATRMKKLWETGPGLLIPESVLYDTASGNIFVSNIEGNPAMKDSSGFISRLSSEGKILELQWVKGIHAPKGMGILKNHLYVTNIDEVVEIDILTATILKRYPVKNSTFLNDIAVDPVNDLIFVSETRTGKVYILKNGQVFTWLEGEMFAGANGLFLRNGFLYIGTSNSILRAEIATGEVIVSAANTGSVDGLYVTSDKRFIFSDWKGSVSLTTSFMPKPEVLMNTSEQKINAADFGIILSGKMILVPTFADNRVVCYSLDDIR